MKKLPFTITLLFITMISQAQWRFADLELKLISHEQNMFIKGYFHDTLEFKVTNLGPDTIFPRDTFIFGGTTVSGTPATDWPYVYIGLDYPLPPGVSFKIRWPLTIDLNRDFEGGSGRHDIVAFTKDIQNGKPLKRETLEEQWNNVVYWNITYRSATSSIPVTSKVQSRVYPNPSKGELKLQTETGVLIQKAELYDFSGRLVFSEALNGRHEEIIDLSQLNNGLYQLQIHTSEGVALHKVVLTR